jgi:uncharacterized protein (DUF1330 family)
MEAKNTMGSMPPTADSAPGSSSSVPQADIEAPQAGVTAGAAVDATAEAVSNPRAAYVLGHITIKNPEKWAEYCSRVPATVAPWGAEVVMRGTRTAVLTGEHAYTETVLIRFPDTRSVRGWYASPAYQELAQVREQAADVVIISYES